MTIIAGGLTKAAAVSAASGARFADGGFEFWSHGGRGQPHGLSGRPLWGLQGGLMEAFPAYFPLSGRTVVIAGEGPGAEAKARLFVGAPARIVRLTGEAACEPGAYEGVVLAFVASEDEAFRIRASAAARAAGVLVNVADQPAMSDFYTPSVIDRGQVVAAIGRMAPRRCWPRCCAAISRRGSQLGPARPLPSSSGIRTRCARPLQQHERRAFPARRHGRRGRGRGDGGGRHKADDLLIQAGPGQGPDGARRGAGASMGGVARTRL